MKDIYTYFLQDINPCTRYNLLNIKSARKKILVKLSL